MSRADDTIDALAIDLMLKRARDIGPSPHQWQAMRFAGEVLAILLTTNRLLSQKARMDMLSDLSREWYGH